MLVKELIKELQKVDGEAEAIINAYSTMLEEVTSVETVKGVKGEFVVINGEPDEEE
ncbi:MAG: hypothetical protein RR420_00875 [Anaerovoracaceae bacterium]